ncbi:hypothetical protein [Aureimonas sp. AU40]|uniref:hypothetical protein n=1 Tax=Aureimonas sp. AU40 TaxID=1637747 RepID=UPI0007843089|nr:hypothetical protein [Aureimonas sp. AU40]
MKLVTLIALASMAATAAPAFADSIVPGSDAAFYSQATPAHSTTSTTRYGMPHTADLGAAQPGSNSDLVPGSDAAFLSSAPKAAPAQAHAARSATSIAPDMVPGSDAAFLN